MKRITSIVFDMDGVITDSEPIHVKAERMTCDDFGLEVPLAEWSGFKGRKSEDIFGYIINKYGNSKLHPVVLARHKMEKYLDIAKQEIREIPGAVNTLKGLAANNFKLALATSSRKQVQNLAFEKLGLEGVFDAVLTVEDIERAKPFPDIYLMAVARIKERPENCVVIEDSDNGIIAAKSAGCLAIGMTTSFPKKTLLRAGADVVVSDYEELNKIFYR